MTRIGQIFADLIAKIRSIRVIIRVLFNSPFEYAFFRQLKER